MEYSLNLLEVILNSENGMIRQTLHNTQSLLQQQLGNLPKDLSMIQDKIVKTLQIQRFWTTS